MRTFVSYPAGIARMPLGRFVLFSTLGSLPWNAALIGAGFLVGENYPQIEAAIKPYEYVIYAVVIGLIVLVIVRWQIGKRRAPRRGSPRQLSPDPCLTKWLNISRNTRRDRLTSDSPTATIGPIEPSIVFGAG